MSSHIFMGEGNFMIGFIFVGSTLFPMWRITNLRNLREVTLNAHSRGSTLDDVNEFYQIPYLHILGDRLSVVFNDYVIDVHLTISLSISLKIMVMAL